MRAARSARLDRLALRRTTIALAQWVVGVCVRRGLDNRGGPPFATRTLTFQEPSEGVGPVVEECFR